MEERFEKRIGDLLALLMEVQPACKGLTFPGAECQYRWWTVECSYTLAAVALPQEMLPDTPYLVPQVGENPELDYPSEKEECCYQR